MPSATTPRKRCKLAHVHMETNGDKSNLIIELSGHETALAEASGLLNAGLDNCYIERSPGEKRLKIVTPLPAEKPEEQAYEFIAKLHDLTQFRLSGIYMQPDFDKVGEDPKATYMSTILVQRSKSKSDPDNLAGYFSQELVRRTFGMVEGYAPDPYSPKNEVRLLHLTHNYDTDTEALTSAESDIRTAEKKLGIFNARQSGLMLTSLRSSIIKNPRRKSEEMNVPTARLEGNADALDNAMRVLKHRHRNRIAEVARGDNFLDVCTSNGREADPTALLAAVHMTTGCELPVELAPLVRRDTEAPYAYEPVIEARISGDASGLSQPTMRFAAARYAGSFVPEIHSVPQEIDPQAPMHIVVHRGHTSEEAAQQRATELTERISQRLKNIHQERQR